MLPKYVPAEFVAKFEFYKDRTAAMLAPRHGWISDLDCDNTLVSGLSGTVIPCDLERALISKGEWTRRDLAFGDCYQDGSGSRISRDMLLGVAWWAWRMKRPDIARDVLDYYEAHGGWMGPGDASRSNLRHQLRDTFRLIAGEKVEFPDPIVLTFFEEGYERHLGALHLLLRSEILGHISTVNALWGAWMAFEQPQNPLFALLVARFITGDYGPFYALLLDPTYWPPGQLPTFCHIWMLGKDYEKGNWTERCAAQRPGSDWLFVGQFGLVPVP